MTVPVACSTAYVEMLKRFDRDWVDDAVFTSPDEQRQRDQAERRRVILAAGGEIADVIPIRGVS